MIIVSSPSCLVFVVVNEYFSCIVMGMFEVYKYLFSLSLKSFGVDDNSSELVLFLLFGERLG